MTVCHHKFNFKFVITANGFHGVTKSTKTCDRIIKFVTTQNLICDMNDSKSIL